MTKFLFLAVCFSLFQLNMSAQKISGKITDENDIPLEYASIIMLQKKDSSMVSFTNSNRKGEFVLSVANAGEYVIQILYLGYETSMDSFTIGDKDVVMATKKMRPSTQNLEVIEIKDYASPMTFGKDTIQYNASAFKIKPGDMTEDLLKKLPGIEVQRDGSVKALGETVQNILVDGKEFFGKDTKIATKNIDADAIDKVQVFDRKSDRTDFTGIDDGQRERSINLKLKEDKKVGYFGTVQAEGGTKDRFKARANVNRFTPNLRSSFIGMANNINEQNFSMNDYIDFMGGIGALMGGGSSGAFTLNLDQNAGLPIGIDNNQGVQKSVALGYNLNSTFSKNASLEGSVFGNYFNNNLQRKSNRENLLTGSNFFTNTTEDQNSRNNTGNFTLKFKTKFDTTQNLVIRANGNLGSNYLKSIEYNELLNAASVRQNTNDNDYALNGGNGRVATDILWQKKLRKKGRTFSLNAIANLSDQHSDVNLLSMYQVLLPRTSTNQIHQDQQSLNDGLYYKGEASYTEPILKKGFLEFKTSVSNQNNRTSTDYFDIVNENKVKNNLLSSLYQRDYYQINTGTNYIFSKQNYNLTIGARYKTSQLLGRINENLNRIQNKFQAILPNALFSYRFAMSEHLNFNYNSDLNEPSIQQLQPQINNSNPLSVYIGNPNLKAEERHDAHLSYMKYNAFNFTMFYLSLQSNYTRNKITESLTIDSSLVRYYSPINIKNEYTTSGRVEYETPIRPLKIKARVVLKSNYNRGYSIINNVSNLINRYGYGYNFSLENRNKDVVDLIVGYKTNNSKSTFTGEKILNQSYSEKTIFSELGINIKDRVSIKSNIDYMTIKPSFSSTATSYPLWTASISAYVTKDKKLRATISCFDILDQNLGIRTSSSLNYTDVTTSNVLGRYIMMGLSYNIKGFQKKSGIEINMGGRD